MAEIKSGDLVQVISGADKGDGAGLKVLPKENRVIVEGSQGRHLAHQANPDRRSRRHSEG